MALRFDNLVGPPSEANAMGFNAGTEAHLGGLGNRRRRRRRNQPKPGWRLLFHKRGKRRR
jgi:hypothetical protein